MKELGKPKTIPEPVSKLSRYMKVVWCEQSVKDPWENITGKIRMGKEVDVEKILKEKGFEDVSKDF